MPETSLRERKKAETGRRVMAAALRLFEADGYDATTVESIAAAAEIAPRTFFRYFPTKVDVLFGDHGERVALLDGTLRAASPQGSIVGAVRAATLAELDRMEADPSLYLARTKVAAAIPAARSRARELDADFEDVIAAAVAERRGTDPATDLEARLIARASWATTRAAQQVWHATGGESNPRQLVRDAFARLEAGLR